MRNILALLVAISIFFVFPIITSAVVYAATPPDFPNCVSPKGTVTSSYPSGSFGIAGSTGSFSGSDTVYKLSPDTLTQCFCSVDGAGTQTNWWKVSSLTNTEINELVAQGWIFVPDGSVWGLDQAPYLAKNANYSCKSGGGSGGSSGGSSSSNGGSVQGASTGQVLGLASTGNIALATTLLVGGLVFLSTGLFVAKKK